jgi:hypothetical protein
MKTHTLKTWPEYLDAIGSGVKTFEVRKDDRGFAEGDELLLREWFPESDTPGRRWLSCKITYILRGWQWGVEPGYVVMAIRLPENHQWPPSANDPAQRRREQGDGHES